MTQRILSERPYWLVVAGIGSLSLFCGTASQCGSNQPASSAPTDAGPDGPVRRDASGAADASDASEAGPVLDGSSCDPSSTSDWPGWTRVMGLGGCCPADVAPDPASALPPWQWGPCSNGAPGCVELAHDWPMQSPPYGLDGRQLVAFATDGVHLFWSEAYGNPTPATQQPNVEVWAAPYTSDPTTLASTAGKVTTLAGGATPGLAAAFQGLYAVAPNPFATAYVVRLLDGAVQAVQAGPGWIFQQVLLVSGGELWAVMAQNPGLRGFALARYSLADW